jgi:hypothetical protein
VSFTAFTEIIININESQLTLRRVVFVQAAGHEQDPR